MASVIDHCPFEKKYLSALKKDDEYFMSFAYNQAIEAWKCGEIPVGAVAVMGDNVIAAAHNMVMKLNDPTAHAEMQLITQVARLIGDWRLNDVSIYVTKEPCPMCAGAMIMSRVGAVVFGIGDEKMGCLGGCFAVQNLDKINHRPVVRSGILSADCAELLRTFFEIKRKS